METFAKFRSWFWTESVWLPLNLTWEDLKPTEEQPYANYNHLYYPFLVAILLTIFREFYERLVIAKIGIYYGLREGKKKIAVENSVLEKAFKENGSVSYKQIQGLAKQLDWSERQVERWLRQRTLQNKPSTLNKFTESGYRFTYYTFIVLYELWALWDKPWFWNSRYCWIDFPKHPIDTDIWWLYMISLSFYWSLTMSQFRDVKRKDFSIMFVHHVTTISLLWFSWAINFTRMGSLVLVTHDCTDVFMEAAKMMRYLNKERLCNIMFSIFTILWIIARLGIYPFVILYSTLYEAGQITYKGSLDYLKYPAYYMINGFLCTLQVLHLVWTYYILRSVISALSAGKVNDNRSDSGSMSSDPDGGSKPKVN